MKQTLQQKKITACDEAKENPLCPSSKSRYQNTSPGRSSKSFRASLTVEASFAFPLFFFAVYSLLRLFLVLSAELMIGGAGLLAAREAASFSYAGKRLSEGENVAVNTLFQVFDQKLVKDVTVTTALTLFCDDKKLKKAGVVTGLGGLFADTSEDAPVHECCVHFLVERGFVLSKTEQKSFCLRFRYRDWTGEGPSFRKKKTEPEKKEEPKKSDTVYLATKASVYHLYADCTFIKMTPTEVLRTQVEKKRNASGAKYYPCEYCGPDRLYHESVYITKQGKRYHSVSTCSAILRKPEEKPLSEVEKTLRPCKKCTERRKKEEAVLP